MNRIFITMLLLTSLNSNMNAAQIALIDTEERAAFGIRTVAVAKASHSLSKPYPAKVAVPNAQLRVVSAPLEG